jgi:hypothetical protein
MKYIHKAIYVAAYLAGIILADMFLPRSTDDYKAKHKGESYTSTQTLQK